MELEIKPVVADVEFRGAVAGLRGLGRSGHRPIALSSQPLAGGLFSRYTAQAEVAPPGPEGLAEVLGGLARRHGGEVVVYPGTELTIDALLEASFRTPGVVVPFPPGAVRLLRHKPDLGELALDTGIGVPEVIATGTAAELLRARLHVPCAVKAAQPASDPRMTRVIDSRPQLEQLLRSLGPDTPLLVQRRLAGPQLSLDLVLDRQGEVAARVQHVATRFWPPPAGSTVVARTVAADDELVASAARLLRRAGYWGLAQLEFLPGPHGPVLIDINPRFYGCLALPLAAGVNLPDVWHQVVRGQPVSAPRAYRLGVTYRWLEADIVAALKGRPGRLRRPAGAPRTGAMWAIDDPVPGPLLALHTVVRRVRSRASDAGEWGRGLTRLDEARQEGEPCGEQPPGSRSANASSRSPSRVASR
jgi:predicted ATP-grasp superfamily ATP-dependent carboligase